MSQRKKPRIDRNAVFTEAETKKLIALYLANKEQFHGKFKSGSKSGENARQSLLNEWSKEITNLGFAIRSKESVEEKIKNEIKKAQRFLREEKRKYKGTGGGTYNLLKLPSYLQPLVEALAEKHHIAGIPGLDEESDGEIDCKPDDVPATDGDVNGEEDDVILEDSTETFEEGRKKLALPDMASSKPKSVAAKAREALSLFTDKRSLLYDEEIKLARLKQRKVQIEIRVAELKMEEARLSVETAKANLPHNTTTDFSYPLYYNM